MRAALVLGYHAISARWPCTLAVSPQATYRKDSAGRVALKTSVLHGGLSRLAQVRDRPAADAR